MSELKTEFPCLPTDPCLVCREETINVFSIRCKMAPICENCATSITKQQVQWWSENAPVHKGQSDV